MFRILLLAGLVLLVGRGQAQNPTPPEPVPPTSPAPAVALAHRSYFIAGPVLLLANDERAYGGGDITIGHLVSCRLGIGGTLSIGGRRAVGTAYGFRASAPAIGIYSLEFGTRYALLNTPGVRLELLNGLGYTAVGLYDRNRIVNTTTYTRNGPVTSSQPARVATNELLLLETGLALTGKVGRGAWLTAQVSRRQLLGSSVFGPTTGFSHWACTVGITMPYGW